MAELSPARPEVILCSLPALEHWAASVALTRAPVRLRHSMPMLSQQERLDWQRQIERLHNDCGCSGAALSLLGLVLVVIVYAALIGFGQWIWLIAPGIPLGAVAALFVGKFMGHAWSRRKLRRQAVQLAHIVEGRCV
jgi:hypothetical protein